LSNFIPISTWDTSMILKSNFLIIHIQIIIFNENQILNSFICSMFRNSESEPKAALLLK